MNLKQTDQDGLVRLSIDLINSLENINKIWSICQDPVQSLELSFDIAKNHLLKYKSNYQRKKYFESKETFVRPIEKAVGTRWESKKSKDAKGRNIRIPRLIQSRLQYVSILDTLRMLFSQPEFIEMYFKYNQTDRSNTIGHDGTTSYTCFGSGSVYKNNEWFKENPYSLQLQVGADDFEICNPLQSKANIHKVCGMYLTIHNMPINYQSKLNNVYLLCLCNTDDLKTRQTDLNNIWKLIVDEIKYLETEGIFTADGRNVKGTLVHAIFDNLGANVALGYAGSFSSTKFCRFCLSSKTQCQSITSESDCVMRTIENYEESLKIIDESERVNYDETNGVKFYCVLSDLNCYHIVLNGTVDAMHDINEGCIPKFLSQFFKLCFKEKVITSEEIEDMAKFYDYGILNQSNIPSQIDFEKRNLGQNASQSMCLFRHLPYILYELREHSKLVEAWKCYESLLRICETVYSYEITEMELQTLGETIKFHLMLFKKVFSTPLAPKQHFLLHYPSVIRAVGPPIYYNMMKIDSKHRVFKTYRHATRNFKAINKSLALQHQRQICLSGLSYEDEIKWGVLKQVSITDFTHILPPDVIEEQSICFETKFLYLNSYRYECGLVIVHDNQFHRISHIIYIKGDFIFICKPFVISKFDTYLNSFEVKGSQNETSIIKFKNLVYPKSYDVKLVHNNEYIISDSRELHKYVKV